MIDPELGSLDWTGTRANSKCEIGIGLRRRFPDIPGVDCVRFKLTVAYDGTNYAGWQMQKTGLGVQQVIQEALAKLIPSGPILHSSSRTDTGVHALGMVAHLDVPRPENRIAVRRLALAINAHLPPDIRIVSACRAPSAFHARFDATGKQYRYFVWNNSALNPLLRHQAWLQTRSLDLPAMRAAATCFVGRHDFASFAASREYEADSTVRTLTRCEIKRNGALLTFLIFGDGFLYKMCRGIVGTLVQVGLGKFQPTDVPAILSRKDRAAAGMSAPAHGLVLWKVYYRPLRCCAAREEQAQSAGLATS